MAEFEQALLADETTGDYAFQVIPGWVVDGEDPERSSWSRYVNHSMRRQNCHAFSGHDAVLRRAREPWRCSADQR